MTSKQSMSVDAVALSRARQYAIAYERCAPGVQEAAHPDVRMGVALVALVEQFERVLYIAENLFQMVPPKVWRDYGGDDMQGHYEGDYHAEQVREELAGYRASLGTYQEALSSAAARQENGADSFQDSGAGDAA